MFIQASNESTYIELCFLNSLRRLESEKLFVHFFLESWLWQQRLLSNKKNYKLIASLCSSVTVPDLSLCWTFLVAALEVLK